MNGYAGFWIFLGAVAVAEIVVDYLRDRYGVSHNNHKGHFLELCFKKRK